MSSLVRRMQRATKRTKPSGIPQFGSQLGVSNPKDKPHKNASASKSKPVIPASDFNGMTE